MADISKIKLPNDTNTYNVKDSVARSSIHDGTLTIQKNGTTVKTFTANQSTNVTANITVPTKTSDITNDSGFITSADIPAQVQANWNETTTTSKAYIQNKPTLGTAASRGVSTTVTQGSTNLVTSGAVWTAIDNLPEPMVFKGTLGTGGTITTLPAASSSNEGYTYKVITAGTYASQAAKVGDVFVSNGTSWVLIPAGDTDSDTWRNIKVDGTELLGTGISTGAVNFKAGNNVTLTGSGNDITIAATDTTYSNATTSVAGLMSASDKTKLNGIATGAEVNVQADWSVTDSSSDAFIKNKPTIPTIDYPVIDVKLNNTSVVNSKVASFTADTTVTQNSSNLVTSGAVYTALLDKQPTITGAATSITSSNLTASKALVSNSSGKVAVSSVTSTELGYLSGKNDET